MNPDLNLTDLIIKGVEYASQAPQVQEQRGIQLLQMRYTGAPGSKGEDSR